MSLSKDNDSNLYNYRLNREISLNQSFWKYGDKFSHAFKVEAVFAVNYVATIKRNQNDTDKIVWDKRLESYEKKHHPIYLKFIVKKDNLFADLIIERINSEVNKKITVKSVKIDSKNVGYVYVAAKDPLNSELSRILIFNNISKDILNEIRVHNPDFGLPKDMQHNGYSVPQDLNVIVRHIQIYCLHTSGYFVSEMCEKMSSPLKKLFSKKYSISKITERNSQIKVKRIFTSDNSENVDFQKNKPISSLDSKCKSIESILLANDMNTLAVFTSIDQRCNSNNELQNSISTQSSFTNESQDSSNPTYFKFEDLLYDERGLKYFKEFLRKEVSSENILFWEAVQKFETIENSDQMKTEAARIFYNYMVEKSDTAVNLEGDIVEQVRALLNTPHVNMFSAAKTHIMYLMKTDSFNRFRKSNFFDLWVDEYKSNIVLKKASSTSSLSRVKSRMTFLPNLFRNKKDKVRKDDSQKSSQTFDSDSSNTNLSPSCKITMALDHSETHSVQIHANKKLLVTLKKLEKRFSENDAVAFDLLDDRIIPFSESMLNLVARRIIVEKSIVIRVGFVQINMDINLLEYVWFVIRPRHHLCLSNALDPVAKRLDIDLGSCIVIKEDDPHQIEWNTQIYLLNKCSVFLIKYIDFRKARFYSKSLTNNLEIFWKKMINNDAFLSNLPFDDDNIMDSRHEALSKYKFEPRKVGYIISNFIDDDENLDTLTTRKLSFSYDDQRGICTNDQLTMPDFLKSLPREESEELSSLDSKRHSELFTCDSDLSFSEFDDFSNPSPSKLELVSDLE